MIDPHVVSLQYKLVTSESLTFRNPSPVEQETEEFRMRLADGIVTFETKEHYPSAEDAKKRLVEYLRAWEITGGLALGSEVRFSFQSAKVIDRAPSPPGIHSVHVSNGAITFSATLSVSIERQSYPEPPMHFKVSQDVETLWFRYHGWQFGREPLQAMAYFCLSVLEWRARDAVQQAGLKVKPRRYIAETYSSEEGVVSEFGRLVSTVGNMQTARKLEHGHDLRALTGQETQWIEALIKRLILRLGEYEHDPAGPHDPIRMADLPTL
ncbi:MAG: hypothetical protein M1401_00360 [Chloroflexi bacterium]|nr:hypothetical protein [Chloroflexota bacterium]